MNKGILQGRLPGSITIPCPALCRAWSVHRVDRGPDVLHRQIILAPVKSKLLRENELRRREGPDSGAASLRSADCNSECTAGAHELVHTRKNGRKSFNRSAGLGPSVCARRWPPRHRRGRAGDRAQRRSLCARCTRSMSEVSLRLWRHACMHDSLTHHAARVA